MKTITLDGIELWVPDHERFGACDESKEFCFRSATGKWLTPEEMNLDEKEDCAAIAEIHFRRKAERSAPTVVDLCADSNDPRANKAQSAINLVAESETAANAWRRWGEMT